MTLEPVGPVAEEPTQDATRAAADAGAIPRTRRDDEPTLKIVIEFEREANEDGEARF
jgi:hypothetical protein